MDEDERDYDQRTFQIALWELVYDPRAHDVDIIAALTIQLCTMIEIAVARKNYESAAAREHVLWIIKGLLLAAQTDTADTFINQIDKMVWPDPPAEYRSSSTGH
jgi:hypothetical protein